MRSNDAALGSGLQESRGVKRQQGRLCIGYLPLAHVVSSAPGRAQPSPRPLQHNRGSAAVLNSSVLDGSLQGAGSRSSLFYPFSARPMRPPIGHDFTSGAPGARRCLAPKSPASTRAPSPCVRRTSCRRSDGAVAVRRTLGCPSFVVRGLIHRRQVHKSKFHGGAGVGAAGTVTQ
jgi:hypothetical protein